MTKYIKKGTTEFEQFNETSEQCFKFGIIDKANLTSVESVAYGADRYVLSTFGKGEDMVVHPTDWIATGVNSEHWAVKDEIFKKTYKKLPTIPKIIADWLESCAREKWSLSDVLDLNVPSEFTYEDGDRIADWAYGLGDTDEMENTIARAWLDGYEVAEVEE